MVYPNFLLSKIVQKFWVLPVFQPKTGNSPRTAVPRIYKPRTFALRCVGPLIPMTKRRPSSHAKGAKGTGNADDRKGGYYKVSFIDVLEIQKIVRHNDDTIFSIF